MRNHHLDVLKNIVISVNDKLLPFWMMTEWIYPSMEHQVVEKMQKFFYNLDRQFSFLSSLTTMHKGPPRMDILGKRPFNQTENNCILLMLSYILLELSGAGLQNRTKAVLPSEFSVCLNPGFHAQYVHVPCMHAWYPWRSKGIVSLELELMMDLSHHNNTANTIYNGAKTWLLEKKNGAATATGVLPLNPTFTMHGIFFIVPPVSLLHPQPTAFANYKLVLIQLSERIWNMVTCFSNFYYDDLILYTTGRQSTVCGHWKVLEMLAVNLTSNLLDSTGCH
ncbi:hypothetical protein STEG23_031087 [Scotinomys teguina]